MIFVASLAVLSITASHGASVGVVRLTGDGSPELEQNVEIQNDQSIAFLREGFIIPREGKMME